MDEKERGATTALALVAQLGFSIAVPMVVFIGGGAWLDEQFRTAPWLLFLGIFLGLLSAGAALYQLAKVPTRRPASRPKPGTLDGEKTRTDRE